VRSPAIAGVTDRVLAVLDVLATFHPADELCGERGLIAFPVKYPAAPAAWAAATVRRLLAVLVDAGIDGGEGQRQRETLRAPWKGRAGEVDETFGFSLALPLARSAEIEALASQRLETRTATGHQAAPDRLPT
jgi:replication initiation protein RepC